MPGFIVSIALKLLFCFSPVTTALKWALEWELVIDGGKRMNNNLHVHLGDRV